MKHPGWAQVALVPVTCLLDMAEGVRWSWFMAVSLSVHAGPNRRQADEL